MGKHVEVTVSRGTAKVYATCLDRHLMPRLGEVRFRLRTATGAGATLIRLPPRWERAAAPLHAPSRIARMESGEQNPDVETIISVVGKLGTEFALDVAPAGAEARLISKRARTSGSTAEHGDVTVVAASS